MQDERRPHYASLPAVTKELTPKENFRNVRVQTIPQTFLFPKLMYSLMYSMRSNVAWGRGVPDRLTPVPSATVQFGA
jgi:hypothetical protein